MSNWWEEPAAERGSGDAPGAPGVPDHGDVPTVQDGAVVPPPVAPPVAPGVSSIPPMPPSSPDHTAVMPSAVPDSTTTPDWSGPPQPPNAPPTPAATMPPHGAGGDKGKGKGRRVAAVFGAVAAAAAIAAGGWVLFDRLSGSGGASSPEAAVEMIAQAINAQDPALAATVIDPAETRFLAQLATEVGEARSRIGAGPNGENVPGTSLQVENLRLSSSELTPTVTRVKIRSAGFEGSLDPAGLPAGIGMMIDSDPSSGSIDLIDEIGEVSLITVKRDGGWYISPALSAAEYLVEDYYGGTVAGGDFDRFGEVDDFAKGASDPEEAVAEFMDAVSTADPIEISEVLPSDQGQVAMVFADAVDDVAGRLVAQQESLDTDYVDPSEYYRDWFTVRDFDIAEIQDAPDGTKRVVIDSARGQADSGGGATAWKLSGLEVCGEDDGCWSLNGSYGDEVTTPLYTAIDEATGGSVSLIVRQVDGGWKVDPIASVLDIAARLVAKVDAPLAESFTMSAEGEATELTVGEASEVTFDTGGRAVVSVETTPDTLYSFALVGSVDGESNGSVGVRAAQNSYVSDWYADSDGGELDDLLVFRAHDATTKVVIGGLFNPLKSAQVTVAEVPIATAQIGSEVSGTLATGVAMYTVDLPAGSSDYQTLDVEMSVTGGDATLGVVDETTEEFDGTDWDWYLPFDIWVEDGGNESDRASVEGSSAKVVVHGDVGASFVFKVSEPQQGMRTGDDTYTTSGMVTVAPDSQVDVPLDLGDEFTDVVVSVEWSESADVDPALYIGSTRADSSTRVETSGGDVSLYGSGSGAGRLSLENYSSSQSATVYIQLDFS